MDTDLATHVPVLRAAVAELLSVRPGSRVLDATVGLGGHALDFAGRKPALLVGLDVDDRNLEIARRRLAGAGVAFELRRANFADAGEVLAELGVYAVDVILADLGASTNQLTNPARGLSFRADGPLDMRLDDRLTITAVDLVNGLGESELADVIYQYGQERASRRIARRICLERRGRRIATTGRLSEIVCRALGVDPDSRRSRIHPATRTFQALRIAVNRELDCLSSLLERAPRLLAPGGRIGVISFHSLEDGMVKRDFVRRKREGVYSIVTKKPVTADMAERRENPSSRSAKFRVAERTMEPASEQCDSRE